MNKRKKKYLDFVLKEGKDVYGYKYKRIFRFFPRESTCHSFNDEPPKSRDEVYKVYFSWVIMDKQSNPKKEDKIWFGCDWDEGSVIDTIASVCKYLSEGKTEIIREYESETYSIPLLNKEITPSGDGISWTIEKHYNIFTENYMYCFQVFNMDNVGYRFLLSEERVKEFGEYLDFVCDYMVEHGDPI